jgi:hypothetical protein
MPNLATVLDTGDHASRPAASTAAGMLYSCSDHSLVYQSDGSSWTTWATLGAVADHNHTAAGGDGGDLDAAIVDGHIVFNEEAAPSTPSAGTAALYVKSDGRFYSKDDAGTEFGPFDEAGAGGSSDPLLYVDSLALHADGTEFADDSLSDVTLVGISVPGDVAEVTTEEYDATCLDITLSAQGDRLYVDAPSGDFTAYLTIHGLTNDGASPTGALEGMLGLSITDDSGTGTGVSLYNDTNGYMWGVSSHVYGSTGNTILTGYTNGLPAATASAWPVVYRLAKVSTTITGGISFNGGLTYKTNTRSDSTTFTRVNVVRLFSGGGTDPVLRVGRLNIVE